jgi:hypothetical protein
MPSPFIRYLELLISCFGILYEPNYVLINPEYSYPQCHVLSTWLVMLLFERGAIDCTVTERFEFPDIDGWRCFNEVRYCN